MLSNSPESGLHLAELCLPPKRQFSSRGNLILEKVDAIPSDAVRIEGRRLPDGSLDLGGGHILRGKKPE